jgi:predicted porin
MNEKLMLGAFSLTALSSLLPALASAQSSVTLGGVVSSGLNWTTNVKGSKDIYMSPAGVQRPNTIFFKGSEDLSNGTRAIFLLSQMFSTANGTNAGGAGALFSRESYVGLSSNWGTLTAGQHRDFMFDLSINGYSSAFFNGIVGGHQGPFANFGVPYGVGGNADFDRVNGEALPNSVKFTSANFNGLSFGGMYGFGGQPGSFGQNSSQSFGANYSIGNFSAGTAYTMTKYASINSGNNGIRNIGIGASYHLAPLRLAALATWSRNNFTGGQIGAYDVTVAYDISAPLTVNLTYTYMNGNAVLADRHAQGMAAYLGYALSKRTSVYLEVIGQKAYGPNPNAQIYGTPGPSSNGNQLVTTVGLQNLF